MTHAIGIIVLVGALAAPAAWGQSQATLDAVRMYRMDALRLARAELAACQARAPAGASDAGAQANGPCDRVRKLSLLVGYLALSEGDAESAVRQLSAHPPPPALASFHAFYLGQAQFYSGAPASAAVSFESSLRSAPPWFISKVRARLGEALLSAGQAVQAAPHLEKAALERGQPELYWQRAIARRALGNVDGEKADLRTLALRFPAHVYGQLALAKLRPKLTFDERLVRARSLLGAGEASAALAELESADREKLARGASARARLALVRAQAYAARGERELSDAQLEIALKGQPATAAEALMTRARREMRHGDNDRARKLLTQVDARYPREAPGADAAYLVGWLDLQAGRFADAVKAYESFDKRYPRNRKRDEAMWFKALAQVRHQKYPEAIATLQALQQAFPRSSLVPQAKYWIARSQQLAAAPADSPAAADAYERLMASFPGSFYALLSAERLRELRRDPPPLFPSSPRDVPAKIPKDLELAVALAEAGLLRDAGEEVQWRLAAVQSSEQALQFGHALRTLGEFGHAHALAARHLWGAVYNQKEPEAVALMYPRAYRLGVEREANQNGVEPYFVWAIMRRESAFRPEVASAANARGLMQVIPPTAEAIARALAFEPPSPPELFSPELSIRLGSWYLAALQKRFGHPVLSAAAYNAGPQSVVRWVKEKGELPLDLWVEEIPFRETRGYVKQVVADYFIYRALYANGEAPVRLSMKVPEPREGVDF